MKKNNKDKFAPISRIEAVRFVKKYRTTSNPFGKGTVHVSFPVDEIKDFLKQFTEKGDVMRIYFGRNDDDKKTTVIVAARYNKNGCLEELTNVSDPAMNVGRDFGTLCPPQCDTDCDPNSIAAEVYGNLMKNAKRKK